MTTQHTTGRIRYDYEPGYCGELLRENGTSLCTFNDEPSAENARRLVACWNACDGLTAEQLERCGTLDRADVSRNVAIQSYIKSLAEQRDALLEAVSLAEHTFRHYANLHAAKGPEGADKAMRNTELADRMEAAIAKAEGTA